MNKTKIIVGALVLAGIFFYGGMKYAQSTAPSRAGFGTFTQSTQRGNRTFGANGGGMVVGDIISKDAMGVTVKLGAGGSKIVLIPNSVSVMKTVIGSQADLVVGKSVIVNGTTNSDGSVTATSIQIRQATTTRP